MEHDRRNQLTDGELPDDRLCVMLYRASHAMTAAYRVLLEPLGLTYPQYTVMSALWQKEVATIGDLGAVLDSDHNTMSPLIKRLEAKNLVRRQRNVDDEREVVVRLTTDGRRLAGQAAGIQTEITRATGIDAVGRAQLIDQLRQLEERLHTFVG